MAKKAILIESTLAQYTADEFSFLQTLFHGAGILGDSTGALGLAVSQRGAGANMSVDVSIGNALITFLKNSVTWKIIGLSSAIENVVIAANASGSNRVDAIIMRASVSLEPNALKNNIITVERVAGSGVSALSNAAIQALIGSDAFIRLADVTVPNAAASIVNANIADTRVQVKTNEAVLLGPKVINFTVVTSDPTTLVEGMLWYNSTTHTLKYRDSTTTQTLQTSLSDSTTQSDIDQSQTTRNGSVEVGEANATTKKNKLFQSFIAGKSKIRGVRLWKLVNLGSFTGTVTISLQADNAGSPSGSDLVSKTFTNTDWNNLGLYEFDALFSAEYASLVVGSLYWIAIACSTSDNSNHPALGTNTAGGYASGSVKYWNTTDGYVAIATIDLYFKTLEGNASQIMKTAADGKVSRDLLPVPAYMQMWPYGTTVYTKILGGNDPDIAYWSNPDNNTIDVMPRNKAGSYPAKLFSYNVFTGVLGSPGGTNIGLGQVMTIGSNVYIMECSSQFGGSFPGTLRMIRADKKILTNAVVMTTSGGTMFSGNVGSQFHPAYTDGTFLYVWKSTTTWEKYSISGTVLTYVADITGGPSGTTFVGICSDAQYLYVLSLSASVYTLSKYSPDGSSLIESAVIVVSGSLFGATASHTVIGITTGNLGVVYMVVSVTFSTATTNNTGGVHYYFPISTS